MVARAEQILAADVDRALLVRARGQRRVPIEAQLLGRVGFGLDVARLERVPVDARHRAALRFGIHVIFRIGRVGKGEEAVSAEHALPAAVADAARIGAVAHPVGVVLQAAVDLVRVLRVDGDVVELADRQVVALDPGIRAVVTDP